MGFTYWDQVEDFTVADVLLLWFGEVRDPVTASQAIDLGIRLVTAIQSGELPCLDFVPTSSAGLAAWLDSQIDIGTKCRTWRVTRAALKAWCESKGHRPAFLFPEARQPDPALPEPVSNPLSATERGNLQKQIAALALRLADSNPSKFNRNGKVIYSPVAVATKAFMDSIDKKLNAELGIELNRRGVSVRELRDNISAGMKLLLLPKS